MTRNLLTVVLALGCLGVGLWTAVLCCRNHEAGESLDELQRTCEAAEKQRDQLEVLVHSHIPGEPPFEPTGDEPAQPEAPSR